MCFMDFIAIALTYCWRLANVAHSQAEKKNLTASMAVAYFTVFSPFSLKPKSINADGYN